MNNAIGGYFELSLHHIANFPHSDGIMLNTGRNALELILRAMRPSHIYLPYFTCDVILEPLQKLSIPHTFYHIDHALELSELINLKPDEMLIYNNYFGLKDSYTQQLAAHYGKQLIIDNAQALYASPTPNCIYSPRKFVGLPDGGVAYCSSHPDIAIEQDISYDRCTHMLRRIDTGASSGYNDFRVAAKQLCHQPIRRMSQLTRRMIESIDFEQAAIQRRRNFTLLHESLKDTNKHSLALLKEVAESAVPMVYPYMPNNGTGAELKKRLIANNIFVATYWPNIKEWCSPDAWEHQISEQTAFLPIDQRYGDKEMEQIISTIDNNNL